MVVLEVRAMSRIIAVAFSAIYWLRLLLQILIHNSPNSGIF